MKIIFKILIILVILFTISFIFIKRPLNNYISNSENKNLGDERLSMFSEVSDFCEYHQNTKKIFFLYINKGEQKIIRTKKYFGCDFDLGQSIRGEKITLIPNAENPKKIMRENGQVYKVVQESIPWVGFNFDDFPSSPGFENKNIQDPSRINLYLEECNKIKEISYRDNCVFREAKITNDPSYCSLFKIKENIEDCVKVIETEIAILNEDKKNCDKIPKKENREYCMMEYKTFTSQ